MNLGALLAYAAPYRRLLAASAILMLLETGIALTLPWLGGQFAQQIFSGKEAPGSAGTPRIVMLLIVLFAVLAIVRFGSSALRSQTFAHILADMRQRIFDHLQALPLSFHHERRKGDLLALITYEVTYLTDFITNTLLSFAPLALMAMGAVALMLRIDMTLAVIVALLVPVFYVCLRIVGRELRPLAQQLQESTAAAVAIADENLGMLPAVKTFTRETLESLRYGRQVRQTRDISVREQRIYAALEPSVQFLCAAAVVLLLWVASSRSPADQMSAGQMVTFLLYAALLTRPIAGLAGVYGQWAMARGTLNRLQQVLGERPEPFDAALPDLPPAKGHIEFRGLGFAYPDRPPLFHHFNARIEAGETLAITGPNGAGKSTLAHLLMRLHEVNEGQIFIDGLDISKVGLRSLRKQIGIVPQHVLLFNGTVRENISFGNPDVDMATLERHARAAQAHDFIQRLPQGYDTPIGDHGVRLSGGQRQRIALARALIKEPPILILDEPTAMFDPEAEKSFIEECRHALASRTVLLITHRPASLALADRVLRVQGT